MPKVKIDYSSTLFYKIFCKDTVVEHLYIGHTTNFVQRKHAHKQSCSNTKTINYKCKLYSVIRDNGGWDNWKMQIIAFHECDDLMEAKKYEQKYFEEYNATLNSIEPLPKPKPKIIKEVIKKEKQLFYCNLCNVHFGTTKLYEVHNKTKKHIKMTLNPEVPKTAKIAKISKQFKCEICDYNCSKQSEWKKHTMTSKHINRTKMNDLEQINSQTSQKKFICECGKEYPARNSLWYHKKKCSIVQGECKSNNNNIPTTDIDIDKELLIKMLLKNQDIMEGVILKNSDVMDKMIEMMSNR
jgi:hypothetical protein